MRTRWAAGAVIALSTALWGAPVVAQEATSPGAGPLAVDPVASPGCGTSTVGQGTTSGTMEVGGLARSWIVHVPPAHDGVTPLPLVIQLHGYGMDAGFALDLAGFDDLGDEQGFVTVAPQGRGGLQRWMFELDAVEIDPTLANPDLAFIDALIDRLAGELCLDEARIYATGDSNGAFAASAIPCALSERIAAVAPVIGVVDYGEACTPAHPVPLIAFHGTDDPAVLFEGGFGDFTKTAPTDTGGSFYDLPMTQDPVWDRTVPERVAGIAARNGCGAVPVTEEIATGVERIAYPCPAGADTELVVVEGGGHTWPGHPVPGMEALGLVTTAIDATTMIWAFFERHPLELSAAPTSR